VVVAVLSVSGVYLRSTDRSSHAMLQAETARFASTIQSYIEWCYQPAPGGGRDLASDASSPWYSQAPPCPLPPNMIHSPTKLVWKMTIELCTDTGYVGLNVYKITVIISLDQNRNGLFDEDEDPELNTFTFLLHKNE